MGVFIGLSGALIGTFTTYITSKIGKKTSSNTVAGVGLLTLFYLTMLVVIIAIVLTTLVESLTVSYQQALLVTVPTVAIMISFSFIRRYFWHEPLLKMDHPKQLALHNSIKSTSLLQPLLLAGTLLYLVLPVLVVSILSLSLISLVLGELSVFWILPFAIGFITPLYGILALLSTKTKASKVLLWKDKTKATMYLYCGFSLLVLSWIVLYTTIMQGGL
jgi:hypothetical protein